MDRLLERLDRLFGTRPGESATERDGVQHWRRRVLDVAMVVGLALGAISVIPGVIRAALEHNYVLLVADVVVLVLAAVVLLGRRFPYHVRAGLLVLAAYGIGLVQLVTSGVHTPAPLWLFAAPVLAAILFDLRLAMGLVGVVVIALLAQLAADAVGALPPDLAAEVGTPRWVEVATDLVLLALVVSLFMGVLLQGLRTSFDRVHRVGRDLKEERERLLRVNEELQQEIARRKRAEDDREQMAAAMEQARKMQAIGTFAGGIAHDFNNLLVPILGTAELMRADAAGEARDRLDDIMRSARRGKELVAQILAFSRGGRSGDVIIGLAAAVEETERLLRASLPAAIDLEVDLADPGPVRLSLAEAQQVLMNLCTNAFHAMRGDGGTLRIAVDRVAGDEVRTAEGAVVAAPPVADREYVRLTVADIGEGMPREHLERIFEPFFTTKPASEGTGLGLAMVHGVVLGAGGTLVVGSVPGQGTTVEVLLPRSSGTPSSAEERTPEPAAGRGQRILVVDDEEPVRAVLRRFLERLGYEVDEAVPDEARTVLESERPLDALITDLSMPGVDGLELGRFARGVRPELPMILCTGLVDPETERGARNTGFIRVLAKPFDMTELSAAVADAVAPAVHARD